MGLFNKNKNKAEDKHQPEWEECFFAEIERQRETDPLIGAKLGAKEIYQRIFEAVREKDGRLNVNTLLLLCSGLAGMSCQITVRELAAEKNLPLQSVLLEIGCKNGTRYYMGDNLNHFLLESQHSVWSLAAGIYHHLSPESPVPDIRQYAKNCVEHLGKEGYKIWGQFDEKEELVSNRNLWQKVYPLAKRFCKTYNEIPVLFGLVLQFAIQDAVKVLDAEQCLIMAMENALLAAKLDYQI